MAHHHHHSHIDCIRLVPIFNHLNEEQMSLIAQSAQEVHYAKNALLFGNGDKDDTLYIINNGRVRVYNLNESGREQTVRILREKWLFFKLKVTILIMLKQYQK